MRWSGAITVDREGRGGFVEQMIAEIKTHEYTVLVIAPKGTRG